MLYPVLVFRPGALFSCFYCFTVCLSVMYFVYDFIINEWIMNKYINKCPMTVGLYACTESFVFITKLTSAKMAKSWMADIVAVCALECLLRLQATTVPNSRSRLYASCLAECDICPSKSRVTHKVGLRHTRGYKATTDNTTLWWLAWYLKCVVLLAYELINHRSQCPYPLIIISYTIDCGLYCRVRPLIKISKSLVCYSGTVNANKTA